MRGTMYNSAVINRLINFILLNDGIADKSRLSSQVQSAFKLTKNRSVFYCDFFAIRFCTAASKNFGNTVLSLSTLLKYDASPFLYVSLLQQKITCYSPILPFCEKSVTLLKA